MNRLYLTILFRIHPRQWETFERYEALVLAQLPKYGGEIHLRFKTDRAHNEVDAPHEIHVLSFPDDQAFHQYLHDPVRAQHKALAEEAVASVQVIRGELEGPLHPAEP
ncbi:MAG: DUF1330 domain-containing protein [Bacteroidota bacterium]